VSFKSASEVDPVFLNNLSRRTSLKKEKKAKEIEKAHDGTSSLRLTYQVQLAD
jgi:hypothetical protein